MFSKNIENPSNKNQVCSYGSSANKAKMTTIYDLERQESEI